MRKGVAIPYIIALILGIVVIGLLGYWFFVLGGQTGGTATQQICYSKEIAWCQQLISTGSPPSKDWSSFAQGCTQIGVTEPSSTTCQTLFGQTTSSSSTPAQCPSGTSCTPTGTCTSIGQTCKGNGNECVTGRCCC